MWLENEVLKEILVVAWLGKEVQLALLSLDLHSQLKLWGVLLFC
jgi:hypothetical protein